MSSIRNAVLLIGPILIIAAVFIIPGYLINRMKESRLRNILGAIFILFWFIVFAVSQIDLNVFNGGR